MERFENNVTGHPSQFHLLSLYLQRYESSTDQTTDGNPHIIYLQRESELISEARMINSVKYEI